MNKFNNNEILDALEKGISKGKKAHKNKKIININIIAVVLIIATFSVSVNISSAFAASMKDIPILGKIVEFVRIGSGYEDAARNGLFSDGETLLEDDRFELSIEGYYFSDYDINIIFSLNGDFLDDYFYNIKNVNIYDNQMSKLAGFSFSYGGFRAVDNPTHRISNIVINSNKSILPNEIILKFDITEKARGKIYTMYDDTPDIEFSDSDYLYRDVTMKLHKQNSEENVIKQLNQTLEANDIHLNLKKLTITPVTMDLACDFNSDSMFIYNFKDIYFKSDKRNYRSISNGITYSRNPETLDYIYHFNSSFFDGALPLTLIIDGIYALPKDDSTFIIDVDEEKVIKSIDDNLIFDKIEDKGDDYFYIHFSGDKNEKVGFSKYNGQTFLETSKGNMPDKTEYIVKCEKKYIIDSKVEISFWTYPNEIEFYKEIVISE